MQRILCQLFGAFALLVTGSTALAQTPLVSPTVPAESPLGESFCFEAGFSNVGAPGFGPYLRLDLPPQLSFDSAEIFGFGNADLVTDLGLFPDAPGNEIIDPKTELPVAGTPGHRLLLITLPVGGVVEGGPDLTTEICVTMAPDAELAVPLPIGLTPVYEFGNSATGANGPIEGTPETRGVTPQVLFFSKTSSAPESERPPGPRWSYAYTLAADVATGAVISPLAITDTLPPDFQFDGTLNITSAGSCSATQLPSTLTPGGTLTVSCTGVPAGTSGADELLVSYGGHITDVLNAGACAAQDVTNLAQAAGTYQPTTGPSVDLLSDTGEVTVSAQHLTVQQSVAPTTAALGQGIVYTTSVQITQFATPGSLTLITTLPDGIDFASHGTLLVDGTPVAVTPIVVVNPNFTKTIAYDIFAAATAAAVAVTPGSEVALSFNANVRFDYQATGNPILAGDSLAGTTSLGYGLAGGAAGCANGSTTTVNIAPVQITKELLNPQPVYRPGDVAVFRLTKTIPAGSATDISFVDFLPLPVFDVDDLDLAFGSGDITRGPGDTAGLTPTAILARSGINAVEIQWPNLSSTTSQVIQVDLAATVSDQPFADGLFLTNVFSARSNNTASETNFGIDVDALRIGAPELALTKGVAATDGLGQITPPPATLPVDGDISGVDANDLLSFVITVENTGNAPAFDVLVTDPGAALLSGCVVDSITNGLGATLTASGSLAGGLQLDAPLAVSDGTPGAPFGTDTALLTVNCNVAGNLPPASSFDNTASLTWASRPGATRFPEQTDSAAVASQATAIQKTFITTSEPGTSDALNPPRVAIGEIVRYRLALEMPEGRIAGLDLLDRIPGSLQYLDDGTTTAAFVSNGTGLSSTTLGIPNINGNETNLDSIVPTFVVPGSAITGGPFVQGTDPRFVLGDVLNADSDTDREFVVLEFNALVVNVNGNNRDNVFAAFSGNANLNGDSNLIRVRLAEPQLTVTKSASPTTGDAGDTIAFTISLRNQNNNNTSPAYGVALSDLLPAGLAGLASVTAQAGNGNCSNLLITDNSVGDDLQLTFSEISRNCLVEVTFEATLTSDVAPGTRIDNTAEVTWTSLPGSNGTAPNPTGSTTPGAPGSLSGERDASGGVNDYRREATAAVTIPGVGIGKLVTGTSEPSSGIEQFRNTVTDLLIGESATFELVATVPEGNTPGLVIIDTLPFTNGVMRVDAARVVRVGASLTPDNAAPAPLIEDLQLGDGIADTVSFNFGAVANAPDGVSDAEDQVVVEVTATLVNVSANVNGDALTNTALVQFGTGLNASASAPLDVVEPVLAVVKSGDISQGDAGDRVTYTVTINHAGTSTAIAQDLVLADDLPADLVLDLSSIAVVTGPAFDVNLSSGNSIALGWAELPLGETIEVRYAATLVAAVEAGDSITNTAGLEWTSLPGDDADERLNSANDSHVVIVTPPGVDKSIVATSVPGTTDSQFGPAPDLTIGEVVTYEFTVTVPEGTSTNTVIEDQLPVGSSALRLQSSRLVSIGANLSGTLLPPAGTPGTASDSNGDGIPDRATWTLGNLLNTPDDAVSDADLLTFEVVAVVADVPLNQSGVTDQLNVVTARSDAASGQSSAAVDLVEPALRISKSVTDPADGFVDGGDTVTMDLRIEHQGASTADAYQLSVTDTLPAGLDWIDVATVTSSCTGLATDATGLPDVVFTFDELTLSDGGCDISYQLLVDGAVQPGERLENLAVLAWASTPTDVPDGTRRYSDSAVAGVVVFAPTLVKLAVDSSLADTTLGQGDPTLLDLTIGETVTYELTLLFPEVTVPNAVLVDVLPAGAGGVLEAIGASVVAVGSQISTTLPGTPVFSDDQLGDGLDDTITFDFGTVTNTPDLQSDAGDRIVVQVVARVVDVPENVDGTVLTNSALFTSDAGDLADSVDVEVVEPQTVLSKSMTLLADGLVRITLAVDNTGTAPAFDLEVNDVLEDAVWDIGALATVSVSQGFRLVTLADTPAAGEQTVRFETDPLAVSPAGTVPVGGVVSASFDVPLAVLPPQPNPLPNTATQDAADTLPGPDPSARDLPTDSAQDDVALPDLRLRKTAALEDDLDGSGSVSPGDRLRYTLVLDNIGVATATLVVVRDVPDGNSALVAGSVTTSRGTVLLGNAPGDSVVEVAIGDVDVPGTVTITYDTLIDSPLPAGVDEVINQATHDSEELPPGLSDDPNDPTGDEDPTVVPIDAAPDLVLAKDDGGATGIPGGTVAWTLSYQNVGNQAATGVVLFDTVPANTTFDAAASTPGWSCAAGGAAGASCQLDLGGLAAGSSGAAIFAVTIAAQLPAGVDEVLNTALVEDDGANGPDPTPDNNQAQDTTPVTTQPDLAIVKDDGGATAQPGQALAWTLQFANIGAQGATGVTLTDTVPTHTTFNVAASTAGWSCAPSAAAGSTCTLNAGDLAAGASGSAVFAVIVDTPLPAGVEELLNTASIADDGANGPDPTPDNNQAQDTTPVDAAPDLAIGKDDGGAIAVPGGTVAWTLSYQNVGTQGATGVVLSDTVPAHTTFNGAASTAGWSCAPSGAAGSTCTLAVGNLAAGASGAAVFAVTVDATLPAGVDALLNTAAIADDGSNGPDPTPDNNQAQDTTPVDTAPDLAIGKDDGGAIAVPGGTVAWTLSYQNVGSQGATGVVLSDTVPANTTFNGAASTAGWSCAPSGAAGSTCTLPVGALAAGAAGAAVFAVTVDAQLPAGVEELLNTASVADDGSNGPDPTPDNNQAQDTTPVDAAPDLAIVKDDGGASARPGRALTWLLQVANVGAQGATGVIVSDTVPANGVFNAADSSAGWLCAPNGNAGSLCTLALGALDAGDSLELRFSIIVDDPLPAGVQSLSNTASVADDGSNGADPNPDNNSSTDTAPVAADIDVAIVKDDGGITAVPGGAIAYALRYDNFGNQDVTGVVISETVPEHTRFDATLSDAGWNCTPDDNAGADCSLAIGALASGDGGTVIFAVLLEETLPESVTQILNTATIADDGSNGPDGNPDNNQSQAVTPADVRVALELVKRLDDAPDPIEVGDVLTYGLVATNTGTSTLTSVVVSDDLITPTGGSTPCAVLGPAETCTLTGTYTVTQADANLGRIDNTGTATSDQTDPVNDSLTVPLAQELGLQLVKEATLRDDNGNGLGDRNEVIDYRLVASNTGNTDLTDVLISDSLLADLQCTPAQPATLVPGAQLVCTGSLLITTRDTLGPSIVNRAGATGRGPSGELLADDDAAIVPLNQREPVAVPVLSPPAVGLLVLLMLAGAALSRRRPRATVR